MSTQILKFSSSSENQIKMKNLHINVMNVAFNSGEIIFRKAQCLEQKQLLHNFLPQYLLGSENVSQPEWFGICCL